MRKFFIATSGILLATWVTLLLAAGAGKTGAFGTEQLIYAGWHIRTPDIYLYDLRHRLTVNLLPHEAYEYSPTISPDGRYIAFTSDRNRNVDIFLYDTAAHTLRNLTANNRGTDDSPDISPDGRYIVYSSTRRDNNADIYLMDLQGNDIRQLTTHRQWDGDPSWSPDGQWIVFVSNRAGNGNLYLIRPDGAGLHRITNEGNATASRPVFSPDGTRIAYAAFQENNTDIYVLDLTSGQTQRITTHPSEDNHPSWWPNGQGLVFSSARDSTMRLYSIGLAGEQSGLYPELLIDQPHIWYARFWQGAG